MSSHLKFTEDEDFEASSSEDEEILKKYRNQRREESDSEVEVFGVGSDSNSESNIALSDVEGQEDNDDLPDVRAWGQEKKKYYGTDYVDPDYGGFQGKDAFAAEIEEEEAKNLQMQLMQQLDDNDFDLDYIFKKPEKEVKEQYEETIRTDFSTLSATQKLQLLQKESPEFFNLVADFKAKITIAKDYLHPIIQQVKNGKIEKCKASDFVSTYYQLILNYAINIYMYLLLKGANKLKNHPLIQRLYQYRQLLGKSEPVFEQVVKPQIELLLGDSKRMVKAKNTKTLKLLTQLQNRGKPESMKRRPEVEPPNKKAKLDNVKETKKVTFNFEESEPANNINDDANVNEEQEYPEMYDESEEVSKRAITYQIAKNKGLTPHRKKELRNPRVKHKMKFRKALIRRKGAVREPRKELSRYSGEISGIKATVSKSIKFKS